MASTIYKQGDRGAVVKQIQRALKQAGYGVADDGIWGPITTEAVKAFQKAKGLKQDGLVGPATLAMLGITATVNAVTPSAKTQTVQHGDIVLKKSKRRIDEIIVHCTASREGQPMTVEQIRRDHIKNNHWADIGYQYVVYLDGTVHIGRDVDIAGAHADGHNIRSIGVVYVGGLENDPRKAYKDLKAKDTRTDAQKAALMSLLIDLRKLYPYAKIIGHRDVDTHGKECPSFNAKWEYRNI